MNYAVLNGLRTLDPGEPEFSWVPNSQVQTQLPPRGEIIVGDSRNVLQGFADASVDLIVTDPPYFLDGLDTKWKKGGADWNELVAYYGFRCAHCGRNTRSPDKGHLDPNGKFELQNLIPLCVDCNNWAQDDVIFSENGRVKAVRSERFLEATDDAALQRIYTWLEKRLRRT